MTVSDEFMREWAERAWDTIQLAHIAAIEQALVDFHMRGWRSLDRIEPPPGVRVLCACEEGVVILSLSALGEWRTSEGVPHKPPKAWMPCPVAPT